VHEHKPVVELRLEAQHRHWRVRLAKFMCGRVTAAAIVDRIHCASFVNGPILHAQQCRDAQVVEVDDEVAHVAGGPSDCMSLAVQFISCNRRMAPGAGKWQG
jgi:hypothetical protein